MGMKPRGRGRPRRPSLRDYQTPESKPCSRCDVEQSATAFYRDRARPDGLTRWCKDCTRTYYQNRRK